MKGGSRVWDAVLTLCFLADPAGSFSPLSMGHLGLDTRVEAYLAITNVQVGHFVHHVRELGAVILGQVLLAPVPVVAFLR